VSWRRVRASRADGIAVDVCLAETKALQEPSCRNARGLCFHAGPAELPLSSYVPYRKRTIFMSGMTGAEIVEVMGAYSETGMPRAVFAALVPRNAAKTVSELAEEVHEDDERLRAARGLTQ